MTEQEALQRARALWSDYATEAQRLGFAVVGENVWEWTHRGGRGHSAHLFLYRAPTFLDLYASVPEGAPPKGIHPGFGGVQLYTFYRTNRLHFALTNGEPPDAPRSTVMDFFERMLHVPEDTRPYRMKSAFDLQAVIDRHVRVIGSNRPLIPEDPVLEQRWQWMEETERDSDEES